MSALTKKLPTTWTLTDAGSRERRGPDALVQIADGEGRSTLVVIEAKTVVEKRDVAGIQTQLQSYVSQTAGAQPLVVARYLSPPVRAKLDEAGLSYIDATGNMRVELPSPGLFLSDRGAENDPWRGPGRPRGTLKGAPAAKIVRTLVDFDKSWKIRDLVEISGASTGATYRVLEYLEREGLATRDENGMIRLNDWESALRQWSNDYSFVRNSRVTRWIAPRGLPDLIEKMSETRGLQYAVTGTLAAERWSAYAPARSAMVYVSSAEKAAQLWDLRPTDAGANVMLAEPEYDVVFERARPTNNAVDPTQETDGPRLARPAQVVVDLMTGPGRSPSEAEELIEWMKRDEQTWRE